MKLRLRGPLTGMALAVAFVAASAAAARAAPPVNAPVPVTLDVTGSCAISSPENIAFANYAGTVESDADGNVVQVVCTKGAPYTVAINEGLHDTQWTTSHTEGGCGTAGCANWTVYEQHDTGARMLNSEFNALLMYVIYSDPGHATAWYGHPRSAVGTALPQLFRGYGVIPANENYFVGAYSDTVTATASF